MEFRIADTFTDSLARLPGQDQKAVKTTAFDLQVNPAQPGLQLHRIEHAKDRSFWSVRVNRDIRLIVHRTEQDMLLCYVDHHDRAYAWAERRRIERHPRTGAAQLVEIRERVEEVAGPWRGAGAGGRGQGASVCPTAGRGPALLWRAGGLARRRAAGRRGRAVRARRAPAAGGGRGAARPRGRCCAESCGGFAGDRGCLRASRRAASLPGHGQRRRAASGAGVSVGALDHLPAPGPARARRAPLRRPGAGRGLGRHWQDRGRPASGGASRPSRPGGAGAGHDLLTAPGARARDQAEAPAGPGPGRFGAGDRGACRWHRLPAVRAVLRRAAQRRLGRSDRERADRGGQGAGRGAVQPSVSADGVADGGRRLAAQELGGLSRHLAARPQDAGGRQAAGGALGGVRARPRASA